MVTQVWGEVLTDINDSYETVSECNIATNNSVSNLNGSTSEVKALFCFTPVISEHDKFKGQRAIK